MTELNNEQINRLNQVICKFPKLEEIARKFNEDGVKWAIAAGTAVYIYCGGDENSLDDVDIWIASESKEKVAEILGQEWQQQSSERHRAENITFGNLDIFTECRKFDNDKQILDYKWTKLVEENLREVLIGDVSCKIIAPEDAVLLKTANPRDKDRGDIQRLEQIGLDNNYLQKRFDECNLNMVGKIN